MGPQSRERQRPDLGLGELPIILEQRVVEAGRKGQRVAVTRHGDRDGVERIDGADIEALGARRLDPLARAAHRLQHRQGGRAETALGQQNRQSRRCRAVPRQDKQPGPRLEMRHDPGQRATVEGDEAAFGQRPAEARAGQG